MSDPDWITVLLGSMTEALVGRGLLESNGVPARILDENIKVMDPFVTGANALAIEVQVPMEHRDEARRILDTSPAEAPDAEPSDPVEERVRKLGVRIRWASLLTLTVPYAWWLAWPYFAGVKRLGRTPEGHGLTMAALAYGLVLLFGTTFFFL